MSLASPAIGPWNVAPSRLIGRLYMRKARDHLTLQLILRQQRSFFVVLDSVFASNDGSSFILNGVLKFLWSSVMEIEIRQPCISCILLQTFSVWFHRLSSGWGDWYVFNFACINEWFVLFHPLQTFFGLIVQQFASLILVMKFNCTVGVKICGSWELVHWADKRVQRSQ